jgi:hypothetical protein
VKSFPIISTIQKFKITSKLTAVVVTPHIQIRVNVSSKKNSLRYQTEGQNEKEQSWNGL